MSSLTQGQTSNRGLVFVLEGPECAGKTTVYKVLTERLGRLGFRFVPEYAKKVPKGVHLGTGANELADWIMAAIIAADMREIAACTDNGVCVLQDRGWLSHIVYARVRKQRNPNAPNPDAASYLHAAYRALYPTLIRHTRIIMLKLNAQEALRRFHARSTLILGHHPDEEWLNLVNEEFARAVREHTRLDKSLRFVEVDASASIDSVADVVYRHIVNACSMDGIILCG